MILKFVKVESKIQKDFPGGSDGKESRLKHKTQGPLTYIFLRENSS